MVTRETSWPAGTPCWADLGADVDKSTAFYSALFGWEVDKLETAVLGYWTATLGGRNAAGLGAQQDMAQPPQWTTYLATDDADATAAKIFEAGGHVVVAPMDVEDQGRIAIAVDTAGAMFGIWQAGSHTGLQVTGESGSITWSENTTQDFDGSQKFYADVFGYSYADLSDDDSQYATITLGGDTVGGIGSAFGDAPSAWLTYFAVADTDAAVAKVAELGGWVVMPPTDSPNGRAAVVSDDQGAVFAVIDPSTKA
ncbi:VOC family protein [Umezawaea tangerina]|uniref:VOC domain-containing protein n=1 Tax=Umezawaea tangerina TaxID=84725 RepID=A0A2T0T4L2_9PSEU|nr:VOC family protein [Umezawaea tangerina]PRY40625.1 hypothetical protein CLV43_106366 [Umezawaea tangerina]